MLSMISKNRAIELVKKEHPELIPTAITNYDKKYWIIVAMPDNKKGHMDPFYAVDKMTGKVFYFAPDDLIKFGRAMERAEKIGV